MVENVESFCNYKDIKELFMHFFRCSVLNRTDKFNFDTAFSVTIPFIEHKLDDHCQRTLDDFLNYCKRNMWNPETYTFTEEKLTKLIELYNNDHTKFQKYPQYKRLMNIHDAYVKSNHAENPTERVLLFDAVIHAQHVGGDIFENAIFPYDPGTLRQKVENEFCISNP